VGCATEADLRDGSIISGRTLTHAATIDADTSTYAWSATLRIAERLSLTMYDAAYLELAQRRGLPLATLDRDLQAAAPALNIALLGLA
jgi:predicted nucleic acid-binding protein